MQFTPKTRSACKKTPDLRSARSTAAKLVAVALLSALSGGLGCARLKPFERGKLAHPTMLLTDTARAGAAHVYAIGEGAVGGGSGAEGGCGCN